jgi:hypothetical protein
MVGDRVSASNDLNFHKRVNQGSNLENFLSMASHYGSNRALLHPSSELQK